MIKDSTFEEFKVQLYSFLTQVRNVKLDHYLNFEPHGLKTQHLRSKGQKSTHPHRFSSSLTQERMDKVSLVKIQVADQGI